MNIGDLVKMTSGYSEPGLLVELIPAGLVGGDRWDEAPKWARILWPDAGLGIEKVRDLEVYSASR
jgi:hypothetical protein